ncbi:MAG: helix-turn-helix transcriptional regulator [Clostridiales bacterium]|jgi:transcriptional regulator with XRE-family HTH domain|nr:helix-turn-helix transcriptional regulator [Clostridiales bacterium]
MTNRLKQLRKILKVNQTDFAKQLGLTQTAYSMIENGINPLSDRYIKVICSSYHVSESWLRTGEGDIFFSSPYEREFTKLFSQLMPETQEFLLLMAKELLKTQQKLVHLEEKNPTSL